MIYEWIVKNRKDIDIITSFLVIAIPIVMAYSEALGIVENSFIWAIFMVVLGIASHYASRVRGEEDVEKAITENKKVFH